MIKLLWIFAKIHFLSGFKCYKSVNDRGNWMGFAAVKCCVFRFRNNIPDKGFKAYRVYEKSFKLQ